MDVQPISSLLYPTIESHFIRYFHREPHEMEMDAAFEEMVHRSFLCLKEIGLVGGSINIALHDTIGSIHSFCAGLYHELENTLIPYIRNWVESELGPINQVFAPHNHYKMLVTYRYVILVRL